MNCMQHCVYNICKKNNLAEYLIFGNGWTFFYDTKKKFNQSLVIPSEESGYYFLKEYQGLHSSAFFVNGFSENNIINFIKDNISNGRDVVVGMSSYYCPWHKGYQKASIPHYFQVVDVEKNKASLVCDDTYFCKYQEPLSIDSLLLGCNDIRVFYCCKTTKEINPYSIVKQIKKITDINQIVFSISSFSEQLLDVKKNSDLFDSSDSVFYCNNVRNLKFISDSRYCMSYLFNKLGEQNEDGMLYDISEKFFESSLLYEKINNYYMKLFYKKTNIKPNLQILNNKLLEMKKLEISIYDML